jgi:hypothetical protein
VLAQDLHPRDLDYRGFDEVSVGESLEAVLAAWDASRAAPDDRDRRARLTDEVAWFARVRRDLAVARTAGAASCLPDVR